MDKRTILVAALIAGLVGATPAIADHATPPTEPVTSVAWRVYPYPNGVKQACGPLVDAGADPYIFQQGDGIRAEVDVTADAQPTEHWRGTVFLLTVKNKGQNNEGTSKVWDSLTRHQNMPGHTVKSAWEAWQTNSYNLEPGEYAYRIVLIGDESGVRFDEFCHFTVGAVTDG